MFAPDGIIPILAIGLCLLYVVIQTVFLVQLYRLKHAHQEDPEEWPTVSILVAARNEAENIENCLKHLHALDYPKDRIEILIGNDQSTDYTQMLSEAFIRDKSQFRLINLSGKEYPQTKGKARVLATLAEAAKGQYFLITDADISVNPQWAKAMVRQLLREGVGMCGGTTGIRVGSLFGAYQHIDWMYFMGIIHSMSFLKKPLTVVGNNMGLPAKVYHETGGYGKIPFSITEDYALFEAVKNAGYQVVQYPSPELLVYSEPVDSIKAVLKQRKRWLTGGLKLPFYYHLLIFIFGAWYIALPIYFFYAPLTALSLLLIKDFIQLFQILRINSLHKIRNIYPSALFTYDFYLFLLIPLTSLYFLLPYSNTWKGRRYK